MRRRAIVLIAALLPLAVITALVVAGRGATPRTPAKLPVAAGGASTAAYRAAMQMGAPDAALYPIQRVTYEAAPGLAELGGTASAYKVTSDVTIEQVRSLAFVLGVTGEVIESAPGSFSVGTDERQLVVQRQAGGFWYLGGNMAVSSVAASGTACGPTADCVAPPSTLPPRPAKLPTAEQARSKALDLLEASGMDLRAASVKVEDVMTAWQIRVEPVIDGMPTEGFGATVTVTDQGVVAASGYIGRAVKADEYPLLGTRAAIEVLNREGPSGSGIGPLPMPAIAGGVAPPTRESAQVVAPAAAGEPPPAGTSSDAAPAGASAEPAGTPASSRSFITPAPVAGSDPLPGPPTTLASRTVTIVSAAHTLLLVPGYDGASAFLVPAYRLTASDQGGDTMVFAIDRSWFAPPPEPLGAGSSPDSPPDTPGSAKPGPAVVPTKSTVVPTKSS